MEQSRELEPPFSGDAYHGKDLREIPKTLREAIELMRGSAMLRSSLGEDVLRHYVHAAEWEQAESDRRITDWEIRRGFERAGRPEARPMSPTRQRRRGRRTTKSRG